MSVLPIKPNDLSLSLSATSTVIFLSSLSELEIKNTVEEIGELQKNDVDFFICETMSSIKEAVNSVESLQKLEKLINSELESKIQKSILIKLN